MAHILQNTRLLILFIAILVVSGLTAIKTLPRAEDPPLVNRWATISTLYPGASATRVESLVTDIIENTLSTIPEINLIESQSKPGISIINIELNESLEDTETTWSSVRDKLSDAAAKLPEDALTPLFDNDQGDAFTYIVAFEWVGANEPDVLLMGRYAKELEKRWRNLANTEYVAIHGLPNEEVLVTLDSGKMSAIRQSPLSVLHAIQQIDAINSSGQLENAHHRAQIELAHPLTSLERVADVPLTNDASNSVIRLGDIAEIAFSAQSPADQIALIDGKPVVLVSARMHQSTRVDLWSQAANRLLDSFRAEMPSDMALVTIFEQNRYTETRLSELLGNLLAGFILVLIVLLLTLGIRSAILVALSLPLAAAFTLALMNFTGLPINQMSVTGLIVSLGIMVDNAIVMADTIQHYRHQKVPRLSAAVKAVRHLWVPLLGSTLTTILAFAPIFLMPGAAGEFVGAIAITVSFSLIGSYIISLLLVSAFAARWLPSQQKNTHWYQSGIRIPALSQLFRQSVALVLHFPKTAIFFILLLPMLGVLASTQLTEQFFPPSDRDMFEIQVFLAPQTNIDTTLKLTAEIDAVLHEQKGIEQVGWMIGGNFPSFYYNLVGRQQGAPNFAQAMIKTTDFQAANQLIPQLQRDLSSQFPRAQILVRKLEQGPPFNAPIEVRVYGPKLDTLKSISEQIRLIMLSTPHVNNTRETLQPGTPKISVNMDDAASQAVGWSPREVAGLLHASTTGLAQSNLLDHTESIPVRVRLDETYRDDLDGLSQIQLPLIDHPLMSSIPLASIADFTIEPTQGSIPHRHGQRVNVIEGYIESGVLPQTVLNDFSASLEAANLPLPPGYWIEFGGESAERNESVAQLLANLTLVITLMIAVVVLSFKSFRLSGVIFLVAWQSAGLGLLSVWIFNYPFGFTVIIGLLGLIGLAINAAIVIIAELMDNQAAKSGNRHAIVETVSDCGRHITSTTITTIGGFLPLILGGGGFWPPFAVAIAGGTLLTTLLSFYFVPAAFQLINQWRPLNQKDALDLIDEI